MLDLVRIPVLGGAPQVISKDVDVGPAISADGRRLAFIRYNDPEFGKMRLISANMEGSDEQILQIGTRAGDRRSHVVAGWETTGVRGVRPGIGERNDSNAGCSFKKGTSAGKFQRSGHNALAWMRDGQGLLVNYTLKSVPLGGQIGYLPASGGKIREITNDLSGYDWDKFIARRQIAGDDSKQAQLYDRARALRRRGCGAKNNSHGRSDDGVSIG